MLIKIPSVQLYPYLNQFDISISSFPKLRVREKARSRFFPTPTCYIGFPTPTCYIGLEKKRGLAFPLPLPKLQHIFDKCVATKRYYQKKGRIY